MGSVCCASSQDGVHEFDKFVLAADIDAGPIPLRVKEIDDKGCEEWVEEILPTSAANDYVQSKGDCLKPSLQNEQATEQLDQKEFVFPATDATNILEEDGKENHMRMAVSAAERCQLHRASQIIEDNSLVDRSSNDYIVRGPRSPILEEVRPRLERVKLMMEKLSPKVGNGWDRFDLQHSVTLWRCWEGHTLHVVLQWLAIGSLQQQIACIRAHELAEPLWDGTCWDMWSQHANGASLAGWKEKETFTGKKREVIQERVFCDCLDSDRPCWVLLDRTPDVVDFQNFAGPWGAFEIDPVPKGYTRVASDIGRVIEPIDASHCQCTTAISVPVPKALSWLVTDGFLKIGVQTGERSLTKSWNKIVNGWDQYGFPEHMQKDAWFYGPLEQRVAANLSKSQS